MQQKKIAALDEANARLVKELSRLGDKLERTTKLHAKVAAAEEQQQHNSGSRQGRSVD